MWWLRAVQAVAAAAVAIVAANQLLQVVRERSPTWQLRSGRSAIHAWVRRREYSTPVLAGLATVSFASLLVAAVAGIGWFGIADLLATVTLGLSAVTVAGKQRLKRRVQMLVTCRAGNVCPRCLYDLSATRKSMRCPECGLEFEMPLLHAAWRDYGLARALPEEQV